MEGRSDQPAQTSVQHTRTPMLRLTPYDEFSVLLPMPNSSMLVLPTMTAPAVRNLEMAVASYCGMNSRSSCEPAVVRMPRVLRLS